MKLKVCGMREVDNIREVAALKPDFMGFVFYVPSPRYAGALNADVVRRLPAEIKRVGVFVNERMEEMERLADLYGFDYLQLHGNESPELVTRLRRDGYRVIKAISVSADDSEQTPPCKLMTARYEPDLFLFDTKTPKMGGAGVHFDWNILRDYEEETPYLLSGGLTTDDLPAIRALNDPRLIGMDVNSKFELSPGVKDVEKIKDLKNIIDSQL